MAIKDQKFVKKFDLSKQTASFSRKYFMKRFDREIYFFFGKDEEIYLSANSDDFNEDQKNALMNEIKEKIMPFLQRNEY